VYICIRVACKCFCLFETSCESRVAVTMPSMGPPSIARPLYIYTYIHRSMIIQLDNSYYPYHIGSFEASTVLNHSQQWKVLPMPLPTELSTPAESWEQVNPHRHQRHRACWWYPSRGNPFLWKGRLRKFHKTFDQVSPSLSLTHWINQNLHSLDGSCFAEMLQVGGFKPERNQ